MKLEEEVLTLIDIVLQHHPVSIRIESEKSTWYDGRPKKLENPPEDIVSARKDDPGTKPPTAVIYGDVALIELEYQINSLLTAN